MSGSYALPPKSRDFSERTIVTHYADKLSRDEKEARIQEYRDAGWKSITVREIRTPGEAFKHRYEFELQR